MQNNPQTDGRPKFAAIGVFCESGGWALPDGAKSVVREARVFSGAKRHFEKVRRFMPANSEWIDIDGDIEKTLRVYDNRIERGAGTIVIFASGDPLFYGIGSTLLRLRPGCALEVFAAPNSIQTLCRKAVIPYGNIICASVHGRDWHELDRALIGGGELIGLLTDSLKSPREAARRMVEYGFEQYGCVVGENLGEKDEKVSFLSLREAAESVFRQPCTVIFERKGKKIRPGAQFETLEQKPGMITKPLARAYALSRLELGTAEHFWDIGFCTGSVSVEARRGFCGLRVTAFEKNPLCKKLIEINSKRFFAPGIKIVMGDFFESAPEKLPTPDSVFIGGHGGRLGDMMKILGRTVRTGGRIVLNSVTGKSGNIFRERAEKNGFQIEDPAVAGSIEILSAVKL